MLFLFTLENNFFFVANAHFPSEQVISREEGEGDAAVYIPLKVRVELVQCETSSSSIVLTFR